MPDCSCAGGIGRSPVIFTVHALPMVSPDSSVSAEWRASTAAGLPPAVGVDTTAQPASTADSKTAGTARRTTADKVLPGARVKLLREHFERRVVRRAALLHVRHARIIIGDAGIQPVQPGRRPVHGELAVRI